MHVSSALERVKGGHVNVMLILTHLVQVRATKAQKVDSFEVSTVIAKYSITQAFS